MSCLQITLAPGRVRLCRLIALMCGLLSPLRGATAADHPQEPHFDRQFQALAEEFLAGYFAFRPQTASSLGLHEYDGKLPDCRKASLAREQARLKHFDQLLEEYPAERLGADSRLDYHVLRCALREELFRFEQSRVFWRNPLTYLRKLRFNTYLARDYAPLGERVRGLTAVLQQTPQFLAVARENLEPVLPLPLVETAIKVADGSADFLARDLPEAVQNLDDEALRSALRDSSQLAERSLRAYSQWLRTERLPSAQHRFALGRDAYAQLLRDTELVRVSPEDILELGLRELRREQEAFQAAARRIDAARPPVEVFREIQNDHPTAERLIPETRKNLEAIRQFVVDRRLISIPSEVRVIVAETPPFRRAVSFASMSSPGPFETRATEAYYYVTPVDPAWTAPQQREWLTAFNYYTTDVVSIHEAYPGHYVQHLHLNRSPVSKIRKVFTSYAFVEGWAHYAEQMVLDEGFPGDGDETRAARYRLAQSDEALLRLCRLCVSVQMHCNDMTVEEATRFFQEHCHYQEQPARQEAVRGTYDPGYLHYALGKLMILKLRRDWQQQEGDRYSLRRFHDEMLRHGAPPLPLLRRAMLQEPRSWDEVL